MKQHSFNYNFNKQNSDFIYKRNPELNKLILRKIYSNIHKGDISIYQLSIFCRAVYIFIQVLAPNKEILSEKLVNYAYNLTISSNIEDDQTIEDIINKKYLDCKTDSSVDNKYFFQDSQKLKSFMAK